MLWRGQASYFGSRARPEGPKSEAKGREHEYGSWGGGTKPPSHQLRGLGVRYVPPAGGQGGASAAKILLHFRGARRPLLELVGAKLAEAMAPCPFLCSDATCCQITLDTCSSQERERGG